jgi:Tfp pilus assembly protein PilO
MLLRLIQTWYEKMSLRERTMLLAFVWIIILGWFGIVYRQLKTLHTEVNEVEHTLKDQTIVLNQRQTISDQLGQMLTRFDKANTIKSNDLFALVAQYASDSNLVNPSVAQQHVGQAASDIFKINTVSVHFAAASLHDLVHFASKIEARTPYLAIDDLSLTPNLINPLQLDATMRVSSLELNQVDVKR